MAKSSAKKYTQAEVEATLRAKIRQDNIRHDSSAIHRCRWELWLSGLSVRAKLVGLAVLDHADKHSAVAFPGMNRLRIMVGGSRRDLVEAIREFSEWEFVRVIPGSGRRANEYRFMASHHDLADYVNDNVVVPLRTRSGTTVVPQKPCSDGRSGTTVVPLTENSEAPQKTDSGTTVVPEAAQQNCVVVPSEPRSGTIACIGTRATDLPVEPLKKEIRRDVAETAAACGADDGCADKPAQQNVFEPGDVATDVEPQEAGPAMVPQEDGELGLQGGEANSPPAEPKKRRRKKAADYSAAFDEAWLAYPRSPTMSKVAAWRNWQREGCEEISGAVIAAARCEAERCRRESVKPNYVKHMQGWISERRWEGLAEEAEKQAVVDEARQVKALALGYADDNWEYAKEIWKTAADIPDRIKKAAKEYAEREYGHVFEAAT